MKLQILKTGTAENNLSTAVDKDERSKYLNTLFCLKFYNQGA